MQINLKKVHEICVENIKNDHGDGNCPASNVCWMFNEYPCDWDIAEMEEDVKQFERGEGGKEGEESKSE